MSFHIHSASPHLKRELENKLAELEGQIDEGFEYEIAAEVRPREQALAGVQSLANEIGAESVFVAEGVFAPEPQREPEEDPDFAMGLPPIADGQNSGVSAAHNPHVPEAPAAQEARPPRIDAQKIKDAAAAKASQAGKDAAAAKASQAGAVLQRAGERTGAVVKAAGDHASRLLRNAGEWTSQRTGEAKVASGQMLRSSAAQFTRWDASLAEWNAQRQARRRIEAEARRKRQRAAHREAELAAISAQLMLERQKHQEDAVRAAEPPRRELEPKPVPRVVKAARDEHDAWPVWRNAFVVAACIALIGVFLLATGSKRSNAAPATSTELSKPAMVVPSHSVEQPTVQTTAPQAMVQAVPQRAASAKPAARKHVASSPDEDDALQEVTVRHYPNASPLAPPKKNDKGVVQISDME